MEHIFRVFDYNVYNAYDSSRDNDEENTFRDTNAFMIQMFGVDEHGSTYSVNVEGFKPFFYVMVNDKWIIEMKDRFIEHLREKMGKFYSTSITDSKLIKRKKLLSCSVMMRVLPIAGAPSLTEPLPIYNCC